MGVNWIELVFRQRPVPPSELYRNIVKPAGREAAIEMPQSRNDHSDDRHLDVGARLIEDEEIEALSLGETHAGGHLLARVETRRTSEPKPGWTAGASLGVKKGWSCRRNGVEPSRLDFSPLPPPMRPMDRNWFSSVSARSKAIRLSKCAPEPNSIFSCEFCHPVQDRHEARNPEIAGDVEHPEPASGFGKLGSADRGCRNRRTGRGPLAAAAIDCTTRLHRHPVPPARGNPGRLLPRVCCRPRSRWNPRRSGRGPGRKNTGGWSEDI